MILIHTHCSASGSNDSLKSLDPKQRQNLSLNTMQIVSLSIDSLINMVGGIKSLVSESCAIDKSSKKQQQRPNHMEQVH